MGLSVAMMLRRALDAAGRREASVTGVSRFSRADAWHELESAWVRTLTCDLAKADEVGALPRAEHVLFLAGQKFGTGSNPGATWIQNTVVPSLVDQHYRKAGLVVSSTGCSYPFAAVEGAQAIRCLEHVSSPPTVLNVTELEKLSVWAVAAQFGPLFNRPSLFTGRARALFGPPETSATEAIARISRHLLDGGTVLDKTTHFETRSGQF